MKNLFHLKKEEDSDSSLDYFVCKRHADAIVLFKVHCPICGPGQPQAQKDAPVKALPQQSQEQKPFQKPPIDRPTIAPAPKEEHTKEIPRVLENTISVNMAPARKRYVRRKEVAIVPPPPPAPVKAKTRSKRLIQKRNT